MDEIYNLACPASPIHYQHDAIKTAKTAAETRIGECIDYRTADKQGKDIIDKCPGKSTCCSHCDYGKYVHVASLHGQEGGRGDDDFTRERNEGAFYHHENEHKEIGSIVDKPIKKPCCVEIIGNCEGYK